MCARCMGEALEAVQVRALERIGEITGLKHVFANADTFLGTPVRFELARAEVIERAAAGPARPNAEALDREDERASAFAHALHAATPFGLKCAIRVGVVPVVVWDKNLSGFFDLYASIVPA